MEAMLVPCVATCRLQHYHTLGGGGGQAGLDHVMKHTAILGQDRKRHTSMAFLVMLRLPRDAAARIREFTYYGNGRWRCWLCNEGTGLLCRMPGQGYEMRCLMCVMRMLDEDDTPPRSVSNIATERGTGATRDDLDNLTDYSVSVSSWN